MVLLSFYGFNLSYKLFHPVLNWQNSSHRGTVRSARAEQFKERIHFHLDTNFSNCEYNVVRLSRDMGLSRSQLFRKCKLILGKSPVALIKNYRLEQSRKFLKSGIYNVSESAYLAGFNSLSYFSKSFKRKYGEMPSKWVA